MSNDPDDPVVLLDIQRIEVDPGGEARISVSVRNPTTIVEEYIVDVVGPAEAWASVEPARLNVMPGSNVTATIVLSPPRVPPPEAGETPFAVRCFSQLDRARGAVVEADLTVGGFKELLLQVAPTMSKGIGRGKHRVIVINRGNLADRVRLAATEPTDEVRFKFDRDIVDVPGSGQVEAKLTAKAHTTFLKGAPKQHRFEVSYGPLFHTPGEEPEVRPTSATFIQKPWLSPGIVALLALLLIVGVLVGVLMSMREDPKPGENVLEVAPPNFTTPPEGAAIDSVRMGWEPNEAAQGFIINRLPAGGGAPEESREAPADASTFLWNGLQPSTDYCFQVVAQMTTGPVPGDQKCAKTLDMAQFLPPSNLQVTPVPDTNSVQLKWTPSGPQATHVVFVDGVPRAETVTGDSTQFNVEPGLHVFEVAGVAADGSQTAKSNQQQIPVGPPAADTTVPPAATTVPPTEPPVVPPTGGPPPGTEAATTAATTPSTVPPSTTTTAGTTTVATVVVKPGWMLVLESFPSNNFAADDAFNDAQARSTEFANNNVTVSLATSEAIGLSGQSSWVIYVDGFESSEAANAFCRDLRARGITNPSTNCLPIDRTT